MEQCNVCQLLEGLAIKALDNDAVSIGMLSKPRGRCECLLATPERVIIVLLLYR